MFLVFGCFVSLFVLELFTSDSPKAWLISDYVGCLSVHSSSVKSVEMHFKAC